MPDFNAFVTQRIDFAPGLMVLQVAPDGWALPAFKPGQFSVLGLNASTARCAEAEPEDLPPAKDAFIRRAYSIASSSMEREYLEFYIALVRSGSLTPRLFSLQAGDRLWLSPKATGLFTLEQVPEDQNLVFISTGTGLAPYMSMIHTHLDPGHPRRIAIIQGARNSGDLGYRTELFHLQHLAPTFSYLPVITRPAAELVPWKGHTGRLQTFWQRHELDKVWGFAPHPSHTHLFLCGNPGMIEAMKPLLAAEGFSLHSRQEPGQVHVEEYW